MQPLDHTFFKPLKVGYNTAASNWMLSHQGCRISFFDMGGIFATAHNFTANIDKAINGFRCSGLYPINELIFNDEAFDTALLTNDAEPLEICQQSSNLPNLPLVAPIQLPNVMSPTTAAAKLKAVVTKETPQSIDAVLPVVDEYLGLKSAPNILEKISLCPKIPILRQQKRKTESAENLTSSPFKKRLEEHENNLKEKQQAVILRKEKAALNKVIKQKKKSINLRTKKKVKKSEKQKPERPN